MKIKISLDSFIKNFADQFEEADMQLIHAGTKFRDIEEWSSLHAMLIMAMVDEMYKIDLTADDIQKSDTIEDIFNIITSHK